MAGEEGCFRIYRCVSGYSSKTKVTVVCSAECRWTRPNGSCVKICGELPRLYGAETLPGDNIAGTIRRYQCAPGFSMANDQVIETTCLHTGKWTLPSNRYACTVTCGEPPYLENAVVVSRAPGEITQKCQDGFIPTTPILLECLPSFIWTTPKETCVKAGCTTAPHYVIHASRTTGNSTYQAYKCASAYRETGPIYSNCVDGKWTKPTDKCTEAGCTTAPHYVIHASRTTGNSTYQAYKCASAYRETGPIYSNCVDGKWTKPTEKCTGQCGPPPEVEHAILGRTSSSRQYYDCKPGYKASGKMYAMCAGKRWIKPAAACCMFGEAEEMNLVSDKRIHDASGLAASRKHPGYLYTHNDYHSAAAVYVLEASSSDLVATLTVKNAENYDWEDIAVGPCGEDTCIYIGDIGGHQSGNDDVYVVNKIYRVKEPDHLKDAALHADVLEFDGNYEDAYTLLVDPGGALYVVSSDDDSVLHHLPDNWGSSVLKEAETLHSIEGPQEPWHNVWAGDISPDGSKLVLMIKDWVYYWEVGKGGIREATKKPASACLTSIQQPQGATFKLDMSGIYVITEGRDEPMYFVKAN
ncbi:sushi, von Willebrand factor type A, EGF and pentraxin domain-containing protein 1-like [Haliotis rufescens]|uniref:sushi, von Willebrand factor type A, EGF and pentraxin domain-containing protein 1-like n=1 Tax=Haliotis rufescens TaxID=6454 RepID=UPI00201F8DA8|nr:sushi, von Willebrand factor type A, EGF and pentraxin domain-containing protein 1-like [Haliotis rufescens]